MVGGVIVRVGSVDGNLRFVVDYFVESVYYDFFQVRDGAVGSSPGS